MAKRKREPAKWKLKQHIPILAPRSFGSKQVGITVAYDPSSVVGRCVEVSVGELLSNPAKQHMRLIFRVTRVEDGRAHTEFWCFRVERSYIQSYVKRDTSKVEYMGKINVKEGPELWGKFVAITAYGVNATQRASMLATMKEVFHNYENSGVYELLEDVVKGSLVRELSEKLRKIAPLRKVEVEELRLLKALA